MKTLWLILLFSSLVYAKNFKPDLKTIKIKKLEIDISKNCQNHCMALESISKINLKALSDFKINLHGGKQAGNQICRKLLKAKVKYYRDKDKNEQHFCMFKDGSYLLTGEYDYILSELDN